MKRVVDIGDLGAIFLEPKEPPMTKTRPAKTKVGPFGPAHAAPTTPHAPSGWSDIPGDDPSGAVTHSAWPWLAGALGLGSFVCALGWVVCHAQCGDCG